MTRIVYKAATALGILHEYEMECFVLRALLKQRRWRQSKRGSVSHPVVCADGQGMV